MFFIHNGKRLIFLWNNFPIPTRECYLFLQKNLPQSQWWVIITSTFCPLPTWPCCLTLLHKAFHPYWKIFPMHIEKYLPFHWNMFPIPSGKCFPFLLGNVSHSHWETSPYLLGNFSHSYWEKFFILIWRISHSYWEIFQFPLSFFIIIGEKVPFFLTGKQDTVFTEAFKLSLDGALLLAGKAPKLGSQLLAGGRPNW